MKINLSYSKVKLSSSIYYKEKISRVKNIIHPHKNIRTLPNLKVCFKCSYSLFISYEYLTTYTQNGRTKSYQNYETTPTSAK